MMKNVPKTECLALLRGTSRDIMGQEMKNEPRKNGAQDANRLSVGCLRGRQGITFSVEINFKKAFHFKM